MPTALVGLLRKLQPYIVQIPEKALAALYKAGRIEPINEKNFGKQFLYADWTGFVWTMWRDFLGITLIFLQEEK